jgi:hypothetical protein
MINLRYEVSGHCAGKMSGSEQKFSWTKFMIARAFKDGASVHHRPIFVSTNYRGRLRQFFLALARWNLR